VAKANYFSQRNQVAMTLF